MDDYFTQYFPYPLSNENIVYPVRPWNKTFLHHPMHQNGYKKLPAPMIKGWQFQLFLHSFRCSDHLFFFIMDCLLDLFHLISIKLIESHGNKSSQPS